MLISIRRRGALAAAVSCAALVAAAPASAKVKVPQVAAYNVEFTGSGGYGVTGTDSNGGTTAVKSTFHWDVTYYKLIFVRSKGTQLSTPINTKKSKAGGDWSIDVVAGEDSCSKSGTLGLGSGGGITGQVQGTGKVTFIVSVGNTDFSTIGGDNGTTACSTSDFWGEWPVSFSKIGIGGDDHFSPITGFSTFDVSDFKHGRIIDNLSNVSLQATSLVPSQTCGGDAGTNCTQNFAWHGHLIFTKTKI